MTQRSRRHTSVARHRFQRRRRAGRRWGDLTGRQQAVILVLSVTQLSLAAAAWADLATRSAPEVAGRKGVWAAVIAVNFVGPILYFRFGRRR